MAVRSARAEKAMRSFMRDGRQVWMRRAERCTLNVDIRTVGADGSLRQRSSAHAYANKHIITRNEQEIISASLDAADYAK